MRLPRLYAIIDAAVLAGQEVSVAEFATALRLAGVTLIQYRDKDAAPQTVMRNAAVITEAFAGSGAVLILNDRSDLAVLAGWDGVHVGQEDLSPEDAKRVFAGGESPHLKGEMWGTQFRDPTHAMRPHGRGTQDFGDAGKVSGGMVGQEDLSPEDAKAVFAGGENPHLKGEMWGTQFREPTHAMRPHGRGTQDFGDAGKVSGGIVGQEDLSPEDAKAVFAGGENPHLKGEMWGTQFREPTHAIRPHGWGTQDFGDAGKVSGGMVGQEDLSPEDAKAVFAGGENPHLKGEMWGAQFRDPTHAIRPHEWGTQDFGDAGKVSGGMVGVSTHDEAQVIAADAGAADYVAIGPVFATGTKLNAAAVVGLEGVRRARALTSKPLVAIGGITRQNARSVVEAGADSVAVISGLFVKGETVEKVARDFLDVLG